MNHGRLPWLALADLDPAQQALHDSITASSRASKPRPAPIASPEGRLEGPFNALLFCPELGGSVQELGGSVRYGTSFTPREREIAILVVSRAEDSDYERFIHTYSGREAGLTEDELAALESGAEPSTLSESEHAVWTIARALATRRDLSDAEYVLARETLGHAKSVELVILVGYYQLLALQLRVWRVPVPTETKYRTQVAPGQQAQS